MIGYPGSDTNDPIAEMLRQMEVQRKKQESAMKMMRQNQLGNAGLSALSRAYPQGSGMNNMANLALTANALYGMFNKGSGIMSMFV